MIKVLIFGDVDARIGRTALKQVLPELKKQYEPHFVIINAENLAHGTGSTPKTLAEMEMIGVQCFTSGDHWFDKPIVAEYLAQPDNLMVRPANLADANAPGIGAKVFTVGTKKILVVNLLGQVFIKEPAVTSPFRAIDDILERYYKVEKIDAAIVDFHTEATSEQYAMGWYLDGRAALLVGTHTHVPTADARILPKGLGYITDIGMTGAYDEVIGVKKETVLERFLNPDAQERARFEWPEEGRAQVNAVYAELDEKMRVCTRIQLIQKIIKI